MPISLDPREVLQHLNDLGYRNITAEQLKAFIIDLKRLIKHDEKRISSGNNENYSPNLVKRICGPCSNDIGEGHDPKSLPYQAPTKSFLQKCTFEKKTKRTPREEDNEPPPVMVPSRLSSAAQRDADNNRCKMWIRPQTHREPKVTKSDPVALYNNYQKDWAKFKNRIPIDNKHLDLRWAVRSRLSHRLSD